MLHTTKHTGKMEGIPSISTNKNLNRNCQENAKCKGSICEKCYVNRHTWKKGLMHNLTENTKTLTSHVLQEDEMPNITSLYFRFESFGDLINETQVINYFLIASENPKTSFALWTKNPQIIKRAMQHNFYLEKPNNLQILYSSKYVNQGEDIETVKKEYPFIDKVFTVYASDNGEINCGAKNCFICKLCYEINNVDYINELLK